MELTFATSDVHPRDRLDYWREVACRAFVDLECHTALGGRFHARIRSEPFADLGLSIVESDRCEVHRTKSGIRRSREDVLLVSVQLAGSAVVAQDGREVLLRTGDAALYDTQRPYRLKVHPHTTQLVLKIPRDLLQARVGHPSIYTARAISAAQPIGAIATSYLMSLAARPGRLDEGAKQQLAHNALDLLGLALSREAATPGVEYSSATALAALRLKSLIAGQLCDPSLKPSTAAAMCGMSVRYANKILAREGTSLERYFIAQRLERCRAALEDPAQRLRTISDIAYAWGFTSSSHFAQRFKERFGRSPSDYRRSRN